MQASIDRIHGEKPEQEDVIIGPPVHRTMHEIIVAFGFTTILVWVGHTLMSPGTLPIKQVRIEGDFRNLSTLVLQDLIRNEVKGGFFNINVSAIRDALLREPWVNDVSVHRVWPDSLQVYVDEQVAVARWNDDGLLNREGNIFKPEKKSFPDDLPLLEGPPMNHELILEKYNRLNEILPGVNMTLAKLTLDERRSWQFVTTDGLRVVLGRNNFDERVKRFVKQVPSSLAGRMKEAEQIDLRYPNGFAVRWKQADNS